VGSRWVFEITTTRQTMNGAESALFIAIRIETRPGP
jgi:hypothetical protein